MNKKIITSLILSTMLISSAKATDYGILVNTKKCNVTVYEKVNNEEWRSLGTVRCCIGNNGKTPKGTFIIGSKKSSFFHDEKEYKYVSYFSGKCAFHTVPYYDNQYHNSSLGHKRSGGCIRLSEAAAKWIYKHCKRGTKVIIK